MNARQRNCDTVLDAIVKCRPWTPGIEALAYRTGLSAAQVRKALHTLQTAGLIRLYRGRRNRIVAQIPSNAGGAR